MENKEGSETPPAGDDVPVFFTLKKNTGKETHHIQFGLYRFDRRKVKPSGAGYFYCSERGCKAAIKVTYVEVWLHNQMVCRYGVNADTIEILLDLQNFGSPL